MSTGGERSRSERSKRVPYSSLLNNKLAIKSGSTPYYAVEQHFFHEVMANYLASIYVDTGWYLECYPDIRDAVSAGAVAGAEDHYRRFGYFEHRLPYRIEVDEPWYLDSYQDVKSGVDLGHFASGQAHFDMLGYREGRLPFANFSLRLKTEA